MMHEALINELTAKQVIRISFLRLLDSASNIFTAESAKATFCHQLYTLIEDSRKEVLEIHEEIEKEFFG